MEKYINETGESTITHYEIGDDFILIKNKREVVEYNLTNCSKEEMDRMKELAQSGKGLSRYILKHFSKKKSRGSKTSLLQSLKHRFSLAVLFR